jgi:hypothetical protein
MRLKNTSVALLGLIYRRQTNMATPNLGFQNWYSSTLSSGITASDTTLYLNSLPTPSEGYLVLEPDSTTNREIIYYTSKGANFVTLPSAAAGRGVGGTTAVSHSSGVTVQMNVVAEHFEALQDGTAFAVGGIGAAPYADGWTPILGSTPNTVTYNGNRNYDLVFNSVDLSSTLSPGMKLKATRTVAAPDQCADLEASSSQYFSKTSPAATTFTDDFVVSAWVKLESYAQMAIASRYNGTSGWLMFINANGQVAMNGYNGGAANVSGVTSYASLPLNKWVHVTAQLDMSAFTATTTTSYVMFDGVDVAASVSRGGTNPTALVQAGNLEIGGSNGGANPFDGKIAQVAIYNAKVTQANMRTYMSQGLSGSETSLISAYSFDNAITDLNTTNANNLTANGGAVATNADSPFANAVSAGLLEYAEINSVTFSTNTTVNVRVPDTCMIPTSGGVSAVSYSTQSNPYGLPYFSNVLGSVALRSGFTTASTSTVAITGLTSTVYAPTGSRVRVTFGTGLGVSNNTNGGTTQASICLSSASDANRLRYSNSLPSGSFSNADIGDIAIDYITNSASTTFLASGLAGAGTAGFNAAVGSPLTLTVELV